MRSLDSRVLVRFLTIRLKVTQSVLDEYFERRERTRAQRVNASTIDFIAMRDDREWCFEEAVLVRSGLGSLTPRKMATNIFIGHVFTTQEI